MTADLKSEKDAYLTEYKNRIYLVGYMGCGKTTLGKKLASKLSMTFVDTDALFEKKYKTSIHSFFKKYSEETFRNLEREILHQTTDFTNAIIATGGGTPCFFDNMDFINQSGLSIYFKANPGLLLNRINSSKSKRPLMDIPHEEQLQFIEKQLLIRDPFYSKATLSFEVCKFSITELRDEIAIKQKS